MKIANYINLVLAAGLVAVSVQLARMYNSTGKEDKQMTNTENARFAEGDGNPVIDSIMTRHSVRAYTDEAVNEEQIETLLRAGMAAPTAMDKRPWHFVVITDREKLKAAAESMKNASMAAGAHRWRLWYAAICRRLSRRNRLASTGYRTAPQPRKTYCWQPMP